MCIEIRKVHKAEEWNELHHNFLMMEALLAETLFGRTMLSFFTFDSSILSFLDPLELRINSWNSV
jgi:hypothetical protein